MRHRHPMPFDYAVPSVPDGSRIDYSDGLLVAAAAARAVPAVNEICYVTRNIDEGVMRFLGGLSICRHAEARRSRSTGNECGNATPRTRSTENDGGDRCGNVGGNAT